MAQTASSQQSIPVPGVLPRILHLTSHYLRLVVGCVFIVVGILGVILPVLPGTIWFVVATLIIGKRSRLLRRLSVAGKRWLRRWAAHEHRAVSIFGGWSLAAQRDTSRRLRRINAWIDSRGRVLRRRLMRA